MKFKEIFKFEINFQFRRVATWIYIVVVLVFTALASWSMFDNVREGEYSLNSPVIVSLLAAIASMFGLFLTAAVAGNGAVRDIHTRLYPLMYTTPIRKISYLSARFMAAFSIQILVILLSMLLLHLFSLVPVLREFFTTSKITSFVDAFVFFAVPNAFITTGILFSLGVLTRRSMSTYLGAALLFFISLMTMDIVAGELGMWELGKKLDPSGLTVLRELRYIQTPLEIKTEFVNLSPSLFMNRLIWIGVACCFIFIAYFRFSFEHLSSGRKKVRAKHHIPSAESENNNWNKTIAAPVVQRNFDRKTSLQQAKFLLLKDFGRMIKGKVWLLIVLTASILIAVSEEVLEGQLGVPKFPTTWRVLQLLTFFPAVEVVVAVVITFYAGELIWKERDARVNEITDTSPVPDWVFFISRFAALVMMIIFIQFIFMLSGIFIQGMHGFNELNFSLYLKALFGFQLIDHIFFAIVALTVHVLIHQKYLGHLVVFMAFYYMNFPGSLGLHHNLLIFGSDPGWSYSEISGFDPHVSPWLYFKLYWAFWAILLALVIYLFWNRGNETFFSKRWEKAKNNISGATAKVGVPAILMIFLVGGFIFYNTNIRNTYLTGDERTERKVLYEQKYGKFERIPQPLLSGIKLKGEIYPEKRRVEIEGEYLLINKTEVEIDTIHISTTSETKISKMELSREFKEVLIDNNLGHRIYKLDISLKAGDSITLQFKAAFDQEGFSNWGLDNAVVKNGTYLGYHLMPDIGYKPSREISDSLTRKKYNLPLRPAIKSVYDKEARMDLFGEQQLTFEAVLGTSEEQTAVTAGSLQRSWMENGRRYFHYKTDAPIRHNYEIFSAVYEVHKAKWKDVGINIYHHPDHTANLERMANGMVASLEYFSKNFSPYPHTQMNLVEYPGSGVGLNGNPVTMSYSEGFSFFDVEKEVRNMDFPFAVIAHEVAHQWWGGELRPAYVEGSALLTESLAWYSSMMVVEETFGKEHLERLVRVLRQEYLTPRSPADVPLLRATDKFNAYRKGPFAMFALKEYVGGEKVNLALKSLLEKFEPGQPPLPTSLDLYAELKTVTPDSLHYLLVDLFERNTYWKLKAESAVATPTKSGKWEVNFKVSTGKDAIDKEGNLTNFPMKDYVEIAVYANSPEGDLGELLYLKKHQLRSGEQTLTITVPQKPDVAGIDPNRLLIDQDMYDNFSEIQLEESI